jgi:hypothetical protein
MGPAGGVGKPHLQNLNWIKYRCVLCTEHNTQLRNSEHTQLRVVLTFEILTNTVTAETALASKFDKINSVKMALANFSLSAKYNANCMGLCFSCCHTSHTKSLGLNPMKHYGDRWRGGEGLLRLFL